MDEVKGKLLYDQDSKRFHRYIIETDDGFVGNVYFSKEGGIPKKVTLDVVPAAERKHNSKKEK